MARNLSSQYRRSFDQLGSRVELMWYSGIGDRSGRDVTGKVRGSATNLAYLPTRYGPGYSTTGAGAAIAARDIPALYPQQPLSIVLIGRFQPLGTATIQAVRYFGDNYGWRLIIGGWTSTALIFNLSPTWSGGSNTVEVPFTAGGEDAVVVISSSISATRDFTIYKNGALIGSASNGIDPSATPDGSSRSVYLLQADDGASKQAFAVVAVLRGTVTQQEARALALDWRRLLPVRRRIYIPLTASDANLHRVERGRSIGRGVLRGM